MTTRVLLTIDTELVWRHHHAGLGWEENYARSVEPAGVGLGFQLVLLRDHGLKAVFFVDPMPAMLFGLDPVKRIVDAVLGAGQDVQLHLHPMWCGARLDGGVDPGAEFELCGHDFAEQKVLIAEARALLVEAGAPPPIAFRAGSYAANDDTLRALADLGLRYDSSHNGCEAPWPSAISLPAAEIGPVDHCGVTEIPVSQLVQPRGGLRHLQLCAVSLAEMRGAIDHAVAARHPLVTLVSHSFELARRDGLGPNRIAVRRFERLCRLLEARADTAPTAHFADLNGLGTGTGAVPATGSVVATAHRMAEQLWSNMVEERAR